MHKSQRGGEEQEQPACPLPSTALVHHLEETLLVTILYMSYS